MKRDYYSDEIQNFNKRSSNEILGFLTQSMEFALELTQREAWSQQITILQKILTRFIGKIYFEYAIPRMGRRIDVVLVIENVIFILEFKVGEREFLLSAIDQVQDYALDLKNFHKTSHEPLIAPIVIATKAIAIPQAISTSHHNDNVLNPIKANLENLHDLIESILNFADGEHIDVDHWATGTYSPTPTIIEAAMALYNGHTVHDITRSDASAKNLTDTTDAIFEVIKNAKDTNRKSICFVTGVPGAGKTLVGLNVAAKNFSNHEKSNTVFLSGNGPLVAVLRQALTRDKVKRERENGNKITKGEVFTAVKTVIQNVHHFRDECLLDKSNPPYEHVAIFDEAQRAWDETQTSNFMLRKKNHPNFSQSEPNFLISCLDRHSDWAVIVCLVGGGQEINTGEAGITEWIDSLVANFPDWHINISNKLIDAEYDAGDALNKVSNRNNVNYSDHLHLSVSLRSFRAEQLSSLVKNLLDVNLEGARSDLNLIKEKYPIFITRDLVKAKKWLKMMARGSERYGIVVSSQAQRLKPLAIDVKSTMDPVHWFLDGKEDVRSSYYLEDVATEFHVQGLELDWACVTWDADFRYSEDGWGHFSFVGSKWNRINKMERKAYLKNAYRVLLTRARQGLVIVVPNGDISDPTRNPEFYNQTFDYLKSIGFENI